MSLLTGPGRNSEMSVMMSPKVSMPDLPTSSRCPGDSIWNTPRVRAALIIAGFDVPHLHLHVIPAWGEAELTFANANGDATPDELTAATERLRETLRTQGHAANVPVEIGRPDLA